MMLSRCTLLLAAGLGLATASCSSTPSDASRPANATVTLLTDSPFPFDRIARVDLYVVNVSASLSADTTSGGNFVTLATPNRRINVLALQNGVTDELGAVSLPRGAITAVRMIIDTDSSSITLKSGQVLTGRSSPGIAWQSSAGRPVLNALIHEQIAVPDTGAVVVIDFDVGKAFIPPQDLNPGSTDQGFIFSPVLHAADAGRTGGIAGKVTTSAGAAVANASLRLYLGRANEPENTWSVLSTATTNADGSFKFSYVTQSAFWATQPNNPGRTYIVAVDPPASGSVTTRKLVPNVTVTPRTDTQLGTLILP